MSTKKTYQINGENNRIITGNHNESNIKSYTNEKGQTFTSSHYRKAVTQDMIELGKLNNKLKKMK